jgi:hypothetical protein
VRLDSGYTIDDEDGESQAQDCELHIRRNYRWVSRLLLKYVCMLAMIRELLTIVGNPHDCRTIDDETSNGNE